MRTQNAFVTQSNFRFRHIILFRCCSVLFGKTGKVQTFDQHVTVDTTNPSQSLSLSSKRSKRTLNPSTGSIINENINPFDRTGDTSTRNFALFCSSGITTAASTINAFRSQLSKLPTNVISTNNYIITASQSQISIFLFDNSPQILLITISHDTLSLSSATGSILVHNSKNDTQNSEFLSTSLDNWIPSSNFNISWFHQLIYTDVFLN